MAQKILSIPVSITFRILPCRWMVRKETYNSKEFVGKPSAPNGVCLDAYEVREEFLKVSNPDEILGFLNKTGVFKIFPATRTTVENFHDWQAQVRLLMTHSPVNWKERISDDFLWLMSRNDAFKIRFAWTAEGYSGNIWVGLTLVAILATIHLDHLRKAEFRFCSREDCGMPYEITSHHERKYCTEYCAHIESVRKTRARQRAERLSSGTRKGTKV